MKGIKLKIKRSKKETDIVEILDVQYVSSSNNKLFQISCKSLTTGKHMVLQMTANDVKTSLI